MKNPWTTKNRRTVYDNPWIEVSHREVVNPGGGNGIYGVVHFKNLAVGAIPLDEQECTWLVGQYRYTMEAYSWEIPEGGCPLGTDPLDSARRELKEETGLSARSWEQLLELQISNSVTDERALIFVARELEFGRSMPEETELLQVRRLPLREAVQMVLEGEIQDAMSVAGLLRLWSSLNEGRSAGPSPY